jgi:hypothetical protein
MMDDNIVRVADLSKGCILCQKAEFNIISNVGSTSIIKMLKQHRFIWGALAFIVLLIDILGYYISTGMLNQWMKNYGHDIFLPTFLYFIFRTTWRERFNTKIILASIVSIGCIIFELAQVIGVYPGTFDYLDFLSYVIGILLAILVDIIFVDKRKSIAENSQSGSRGYFSPSPHTTPACGSAPGGSLSLPGRSRVMNVHPQLFDRQ